MKSITQMMLFGLVAVFGLVACQDAAPVPKQTTPVIKKPVERVVTVAPSKFTNHWTKMEPKTTKKGEMEPRYGRKPLRVSIDQLRRSIPKLFNGLTWARKTNSEGKVTETWFDYYARTLGEADYLQLTQNIREATPLFMKFMDDMAGAVCEKAVEADLKEANGEKRSVIRYWGIDGKAANYEVDRNLRFLRLKFHAVLVEPSSTKEIEHLRKLYDATLAATKSVDKAWQNVCVAILTSPEFFAY